MDASPPALASARVLVIRLGALGDFVQSFGPFAAIRAHHAADRVTLMTTPALASLALASPWFDAVLIDRRPAGWNVPGLWRLTRALRGFDRVYDLQTSSRSARYFRLAGRPVWSGIARGCALPHVNPERDAMHTRERQAEQLAMAGVTGAGGPDLDWLAERKLPWTLPPRFALLAPGAAPHRPAKRWPAERFGALSAILAKRGLAAVIVGSAAEAPLAARIQQLCPDAIDLTGRTSLLDLGAVAARAVLAVGNDTGPMHLAAALGRAAIVLFSADSDPAITAPRYPDGGWPTILRERDLADLPVDRVAAALPSGQ